MFVFISCTVLTRNLTIVMEDQNNISVTNKILKKYFGFTEKKKLLTCLFKGFVTTAEWLNVNWVENIIYALIYAYIHTFIKLINSIDFTGGSKPFPSSPKSATWCILFRFPLPFHCLKCIQ